MLGIYTVDEVRAAEEALFTTVLPDDVMQRAASGLARTAAAVLQSHRGAVYGAQVVLLVGTGNNGGDTLFAGASLARRGARVDAVLVGASCHAAGLDALLRAGGRVLAAAEAADAIDAADLVVDGILGIGGRGALREPAAGLVQRATSSRAVVLAVDLPSGVDADTGAAGDKAVWADVTVTFGLMKPGLLLAPGSLHAGLVELVDIGLDDVAVVPSITRLDAVDAAALLPRPGPLDHKYSLGVTGIAAGSSRYPGAAVLAVGGALHSKGGLVRYVGAAHADVVAAWPSAIVSDGPLAAAGRVQAWGVGPGLGVDDAARRRLHEVLDDDVPAVVDADGLTLLASSPELVRSRAAVTILTPHEREFARLAPDLSLGDDVVTATRTLAARLGCTVLVKGSTTVIADEDGQVRLGVTGTPWLATGGTGDVLTGMIAALLASGTAPLDAASGAAFLHGLAGRIAAEGAPITASDVVAALPHAIRSLTRPQIE